MRLHLRPNVGMYQMVAIPHVVALGVCDALPHAWILWPHTVVDASSGEQLGAMRVQAGYDKGMFATVELDLDDSVAALAQSAIQRRVDAWSQVLAGMPAMAPLAPVLGDYANRLMCLGSKVAVLYPNGMVRAQGTFAGVDVWGRATVRLASGEELEFPPEQYRIASAG
ncbi:MAG: hypothetical protein Q4A01_08005 [Coriobacteriales bacterium]|nr:hypothetical protein [Coriobacteriales bacterium]